MKSTKSPQEKLRKKILALCKNDFLSLREITAAVGRSEHTVRAGYIYPMVKEGLLIQKMPPGTKTWQKYKKNDKVDEQ